MRDVVIYGELSADQNTIVLMASGELEDITFAAKRLGTLTPLIKPTQPKGALLCPATWPAVVQLSATYGSDWNMGPKLTEWVRQEANKRAWADDVKNQEIGFSLSAGLQPRIYQLKAADNEN